MADLPDCPDWLARKITEFLRRVATGQITLNVNQHRIETFDFREHGRVGMQEKSCLERRS